MSRAPAKSTGDLRSLLGINPSKLAFFICLLCFAAAASAATVDDVRRLIVENDGKLEVVPANVVAFFERCDQRRNWILAEYPKRIAAMKPATREEQHELDLMKIALEGCMRSKARDEQHDQWCTYRFSFGPLYPDGPSRGDIGYVSTIRIQQPLGNGVVASRLNSREKGMFWIEGIEMSPVEFFRDHSFRNTNYAIQDYLEYVGERLFDIAGKPTSLRVLKKVEVFRYRRHVSAERFLELVAESGLTDQQVRDMLTTQTPRDIANIIIENRRGDELIER